MPAILISCANCGKIFPSGISIGAGSSVTLLNNKSQCPFCKSMENIPNGTFQATVDSFIEILKDSKNPLKDAREILENLKQQTGVDKPKLETFLQKNQLTIQMSIAILTVLINMLIQHPDIKINNNVINQEFYNQYNQTININVSNK